MFGVPSKNLELLKSALTSFDATFGCHYCGRDRWQFIAKRIDFRIRLSN